MQKILVTTDFSTNSRAAIRFALQLASQVNVQLVFFNVIEIMQPTSWNDKRYKRFSQSTINDKATSLKRFVHTMMTGREAETNRHEYVAVIGTDVTYSVTRMAKKIKADMICTATRGAGKILKLFGTHASALITSSRIPLLVIPHSYKARQVNRIFYASDFSSLRREMKVVQKFAAPLHAKIEIFHYDYLLAVSENKKKLENKAARFRSPDIAFHFKKQEIDKPLSTQLRVDIAKTKPSVVVLFTKPNRNWFDRLFATGESAEMAFNSTIPLLIFRKK